MIPQCATISCALLLFSYLTSANAQDPPELIEIKVLNDQEEIILNLKRTNRYLANENLPIWGVWVLKNPLLLSNVMKNIGPFTMYHDTEMSSAVVLFQNGRYLSGVIDTRFYINELPLKNVGPNNFNLVDGRYIVQRPIENSHDELFKNFKDELVISHSLSDIEMTLKHFNMNPKAGPSHEQHDDGDEKAQAVDTLYPEILVFVTNKIYLQLIKEGNSLEHVVKYYLVYFNAVDMLFAKLPSDQRIYLNLAGLVIEIENNVFPVFENSKGEPKKYIDGNYVVEVFPLFLNLFKQIFVRDLFDLFFISTHGSVKHENIAIDGLSKSTNMIYNRQFSGDEYNSPGIIVRHLPYWYDFIVSAHEIAHQMSVEHDPLSKGKFCNGIQCYALMQPHSNFCKNCIKWSKQSIYELREFARSNVNRCFLLNSPRSLRPYGSRAITLTPRQQCACHGYKYPYDSGDSLDRTTVNHCHKELHCHDRSAYSIFIPRPIDGTPCGIQKVCWNKKCLPL